MEDQKKREQRRTQSSSGGLKGTQAGSKEDNGHRKFQNLLPKFVAYEISSQLLDLKW
jgi:hypothetical protein